MSIYLCQKMYKQSYLLHILKKEGRIQRKGGDRGGEWIVKS